MIQMSGCYIKFTRVRSNPVKSCNLFVPSVSTKFFMQ